MFMFVYNVFVVFFSSPDGEYVLAGAGDGSLFVWNVAKQRVDKVLKEHA